jgi:outer membrane lipoprotein SlyB
MNKSSFLSSTLASALLGLGLLTSSGAALAVCSQCGTVQEIHSETQKGKASALGTVGGAVVGGILGNQVGKGDGNTVATIAGAVGGAYAGREIEKHQRKKTVWFTSVKMETGENRVFNSDHDPAWGKGAQVEVNGQGELVKRFTPLPKPTPRAAAKRKAKKQS